MTAPRRTLLAWDGQRMQQEHLDALLEAESNGDEIVVALLQSEQGLSRAQPFTGGQRIERISAFLEPRLNASHYLLPIKSGQLSAAQLAIRLRYDVPAFTHLVTSDQDLERAANTLLDCTTRFMKPGNGPDLLAAHATSTVRRGLFITRAQPFHLGHAACVQTIAEEMDEVVVLVALAETSHSAHNPATAGERLEMIHPYLQRALPGRFYLAAAPYEAHTACNVSELTLLVPAFERVYSNSPSTQALAVSAAVPWHAVQPNVDVSGTQVRKAMLDGQALGGLVPQEVENVLSRLGVRERLQLLASEEVRWEH